MGGSFYDRQVVSSASSYAGNDVVGKQFSIHSSMDPKNFVEQKIISASENPIVFALDVTGSMGQWPRIIYDKMPMFYGQIKMQNYIKDPEISFCAIGDATCDSAPLQVTGFGQGKQIDEMIAKMFLEGAGGAGSYESYEFSAYFYNRYITKKNPKMSFFFVTGDQHYYDKPKPEDYSKHLGVTADKQIDGLKEWKKLQETYNVFLVKKDYGSEEEKHIFDQWVNALGKERILKITAPKACVDVILGAIALTSGSRTLQTYIKDMKDREQTEERIKEVAAALQPYAKGLKEGIIKPVLG